MTEPRYLIRSPLHALLALQQGFKLLTHKNVQCHAFGADIVAAILDSTLFRDGFYIAPESEHLCEPQEGDLWEYGLYDCCYTGAMPKRVDIYNKKHYERYKPYMRRIILRNGQPFPQIEQIDS